MAFLDETGLAELWNLIRAEDAQIVTGSYVGTGNYDANYPNSINLGFDAKLIFIMPATITDTSSKSTYWGLMMPMQGKAMVDSTGNSRSIYNITSGGGVVSWYTNLVANQLNQSGVTYYYVAIG